MSDVADINLTRRGILNYTIIRGDTFAPPPVSFTINGTAEDFSTSTLKMQVKTDNGRVMAELTDGDGIAVSGNILQYSIAAADMEDWPAGDYKYDVQKTVSTIVSTIQAGRISLIDDQTQ